MRARLKYGIRKAMASIRKNIIDGKICLVTDQPFFFKYMIFDQLSFQAGKGIRGR